MGPWQRGRLLPHSVPLRLQCLSCAFLESARPSLGCRVGWEVGSPLPRHVWPQMLGPRRTSVLGAPLHLGKEAPQLPCA